MLDRRIVVPCRAKRWFHNWSNAEYEAAIASDKVRVHVRAALDQIKAYRAMTEKPLARIISYDPPWGDYWANRQQRIPIKPVIGGKLASSVPPEFSLVEYMRGMDDA